MKKILFVLLSGLVILSACSSGETSEEDAVEGEHEEEPVFSEEDVELAEEMIMYASQLEEEFTVAANEKWEELKKENPELYNADNLYNELDETEREEAIKEVFDPLAIEMIVEPFFEEYGEYLYEDKRDMLPAIQYTQYNQESEGSEILDDYSFYPTYDNLTIASNNVELVEELEIHELNFTIDTENTTFYKDFDDNTIGRQQYVEPSDEITFYKTQENEFIIGTLPILGEYQNEITYDSDSQIERSKELINSLPSLQ